MQRHDMRCCCGRLDCALLIQNCSILESVEKDVHTAAELGQALLARHESYMADAEKERNELMGRVSRLEMAKKDLELENARTIEENRALLDQLEYLNSTVADSESHMRSLEATLRSSQLTVRRLESAAERASDMERHIAVLEQEQAQLQTQLASSQSEAKSTVQRWKRAERGIEELQAQLERMEKEAREESDRHAEAMDWMHRRREMDRELSGIGAGGGDGCGDGGGGDGGHSGDGGDGDNDAQAVVSSSEQAEMSADADAEADAIDAGVGQVRRPRALTNRPTVVSHFVRDLLQDNANLQMGIAELREMLSASNDEIQSLREQLMYHQPVAASVSGDSASVGDCHSIDGGDMTGSPVSTLRAELDQHMDGLEMEREACAAPQLHIHHHYHVTPSDVRRAGRRKRLGLHSAGFAPSAALPIRAPAPAPPIMSRMPPHRWSILSDHPSDVASSAPSTPMSSNHRHSLFDRGGGGMVGFETPSSPATSVDPTSPSWRSARRTSGGVPEGWVATRSVAATIFEEEAHGSSSSGGGGGTKDRMFGRDVAPAAALVALTGGGGGGGGVGGVGDFGMSAAPRRLLQPPPSRLRHMASHESIVSLSGGLDIHTLQARPSQLSFRPLGTPTTGATSTAVADVTARPIISSGLAVGGASVLRNSLAAVAHPSRTPSPAPGGRTSGLSKLVAWRPWGGRAGRRTADSSDDGASVATSTTNPSTASSSPVPTAPIASLRRRGLAPLVTNTAATSAASSFSSSVLPPAMVAYSAAPAFAGRNTFTFGTPVGETPAVSLLSASLPWAEAAAAGDKTVEPLTTTPTASRAPGINQPGVIPGFNEYLARHARRVPPHQLAPEVVDHEALREGLEG